MNSLDTGRRRTKKTCFTETRFRFSCKERERITGELNNSLCSFEKSVFFIFIHRGSANLSTKRIGRAVSDTETSRSPPFSSGFGIKRFFLFLVVSRLSTNEPCMQIYLKTRGLSLWQITRVHSYLCSDNEFMTVIINCYLQERNVYNMYNV